MLRKAVTMLIVISATTSLLAETNLPPAGVVSQMLTTNHLFVLRGALPVKQTGDMFYYRNKCMACQAYSAEMIGTAIPTGTTTIACPYECPRCGHKQTGRIVIKDRPLPQASRDRPEAGYVPDAETAIAIAVAVWNPTYGKEEIESEKPYTATLSNGVWTVEGTLPTGTSGGIVKGGVAVADIAKDDGRILRITHGK